jgi:hypothetical protein
MGEAIDKVIQQSAPRTREQLEEELLRGLRSGPPIAMGPAEWQRLRDELEAEVGTEAGEAHDAS